MHAERDRSRRRLAWQSCLPKRPAPSCHTLYGEGGKVGPDLTGSNRANLDYILLNSVDPSYDVPGAYKTVSVLTVDGRVVNGVLAEEDSSADCIEDGGATESRDRQGRHRAA